LLNHNYLLLWGGIDQLCWILNGVFELGVGPREFRRIGMGKHEFLQLLKERAPAAHAIVTDPPLVLWRKVIASARHHAAHRGVTFASDLYFGDEEPPPVEELDRAIEEDPEWKDNVAMFGAAWAEQFREQFRLDERLMRLKKAPQRILRIEVDKKPAMVAPLLNVDHDFQQFMTLADRLADACMEHLESRGRTKA
jgi:hypothetical protein